MKKYIIAVIGATGNVGREILNYLEIRHFPVDKLIVVASEESVGREVSFGNDNLKLTSIKKLDFTKIDLAFFCAGSNISAKYARLAAAKNCLVIDKSSYFRLDKDVPLIVPEVNISSLKNNLSTIIANPNCCAIPLAVALKPLDNFAKIKRIVASTYQSVSGAGKDAMDELFKQTKAKFVFEDLASKIFPKQIAFNLFPHIGDFRADGRTEEEYKIEEELKKIIGDHIDTTITCVRVPIFVSHAISVNVEFEKEITAIDAQELLEEVEGIITYDLENELKYATPVEVTGEDEVFISRIRADHSRANSLNFWICSDNLRKGAALNAVQIAEAIIQQKGKI